MKSVSNKQNLQQCLNESIKFIRKQTHSCPKIAIILGSGLGDFAHNLTSQQVIETFAIPNYPRSTVEGHEGKLRFGKLKRVDVLTFQGRVHFYETGELETILYPIRIARILGIKTLLVTNAAGGINQQFKAGDLMLITDQINLTFENPLSQLSNPLRHQPLYDPRLQVKILKTAMNKNIRLQQGIYCGLKGPSYETASEIKLIQRIGADAVGMSTVNEVSLAAALGMRIAGLSCITNLATGISDKKLSHQEVTDVANFVKQTFSELITSIIETIN